jgi:hypothetical protein
VAIPIESKFQLQRVKMTVQGQEPFEEDLEWLKFGKETIRDSPKILDEASKSFLTLGSSLLTVYTGALALFKLNEKTLSPLSWTMICIPILLWLMCISCLAYVYFPDRYNFRANSPSQIEKVTRDISRKKSFRLKVGSVFFVLALAAMSVSIVWLGSQPSEQTQKEGQTVFLVIAKDESELLKDLSGPLHVENFSYPIVLMKTENQTYVAYAAKKK